MKKLLLAAAAISLLAGRAMADVRNIPSGPSQALPSADYGGVDRSTVAFSSANDLCFIGQGSVVGFIVSSGTTLTDFIIFRDTASLILGANNAGPAASDDYTTGNVFARVYVSSVTNVASGNIASLGTTYTFPKPIRVYNGLCAKISSNLYNMVTILYTRFTE